MIIGLIRIDFLSYQPMWANQYNCAFYENHGESVFSRPTVLYNKTQQPDYRTSGTSRLGEPTNN